MVLDGGGWSTSRPGRFTPGKDPVPIILQAGWSPGPGWPADENFTVSGFDPRTVQHVASLFIIIIIIVIIIITRILLQLFTVLVIIIFIVIIIIIIIIIVVQFLYSNNGTTDRKPVTGKTQKHKDATRNT